MTVNEEKPNIRRTQSHEPRRTNQPSFPLMQIAEKYRKELRDLSKGGGLLPVHLQKESEEEVKKEAPEPETPELENISKDEVDLVREANNKDDLETAVDRDLRNTETSAGSVFCCLFVCLFVCVVFFFFLARTSLEHVKPHCLSLES